MGKPTILITGGTGKFGQKFVSHFYNMGWIVLLTTRGIKNFNETFNDFNPDRLIPIEVDLTEPNSCARLIRKVHKLGIKVEHLVNNARSLTSLATNELGQTEANDFLDEFLMDVVVPYQLSIELYNSQSSELKTITNISSQYSLVAATPSLYSHYPHESPVQYGVSKAALNHLTKELAVRFSSKNIRVNCIAYGGVEGRVNESFLERYSKMCPIGRMLTEDEIVGPLDFLISSNSSSVTGHVLIADGGWTLC